LLNTSLSQLHHQWTGGLSEINDAQFKAAGRKV